MPVNPYKRKVHVGPISTGRMSSGASNMAAFGPNPTVRIVWDVDIQAYKVFTPYNPSFIEALKQLIPYSDRSPVDVNGKFDHWIVTERFFEPVKMTVELTFKCKAQIKDKATAEKEHADREARRKQLEEEARRALGLQAASGIERTIIDFVNYVPYEVMRKAYLQTVAALHPDRGGDPAKASDFNAKWQEIEKVFYQKT